MVILTTFFTILLPDFFSFTLDTKWVEGDGEHYIAHTEYDFNAGNDQELSFKAGQTLRLAPRSLQPRIKGIYSSFLL